MNEQYTTGNAGGHSHSFSGSGSGGTDWEGDHGHWVDGDTSGGWAQDHPAFLVVGFIINY
jgi:hypothetical protein